MKKPTLVKKSVQNHMRYYINLKNGIDTINWGSSMMEKEWIPRREKLSSIKTTNIENIPTIYAN